MFSVKEKQYLSSVLEEAILKLNHPEMPKEKINFFIHVDGAESWSFADITPNWAYDAKEVKSINLWNEIARDVLSRKED